MRKYYLIGTKLFNKNSALHILCEVDKKCRMAAELGFPADKWSEFGRVAGLFLDAWARAR